MQEWSLGPKLWDLAIDGGPKYVNALRALVKILAYSIRACPICNVESLDLSLLVLIYDVKSLDSSLLTLSMPTQIQIPVIVFQTFWTLCDRPLSQFLTQTPRLLIVM